MQYLKIQERTIAIVISKEEIAPINKMEDLMNAVNIQDTLRELVNLISAVEIPCFKKYLPGNCCVLGAENEDFFILAFLSRGQNPLEILAKLNIDAIIHSKELKTIEYDISEEVGWDNDWDSIKDGTSVEVPVLKDIKEEKSYFFEFNEFDNIIQFSKIFTKGNCSSVIQKGKHFVICITGMFEKSELMLLESLVAEFYGYRIPPFFGDNYVIEENALQILQQC